MVAVVVWEADVRKLTDKELAKRMCDAYDMANTGGSSYDNALCDRMLAALRVAKRELRKRYDIVSR